MDTAAQDLVALAQGVLALALGGLVGWEREAARKGAGLRTMMLVAFASFLFVKVSILTGSLPDGRAGGDPVRAVQAIATGLAFLGAGIVFRDRGRDRVRGLTTAATLLAVAPVGIAVALERYVLAVGATLLLLVVLRAFLYLERRAFAEGPD